ncbi:MAG: hypothetical protein CMH57_06405 [Myxococcales bacterium]|nr:hypothetical protein [Myxococcales bacterium]
MSNAHQEFETHIQALCQQGKTDDAATSVIERYGSALLRFLVNMSPDVQTGEDVFQVVCVRVWQRLPSFQWEGSLRAWLFVVARHAFFNHRRDQQRRREDHLPDMISSIPAQLSRTITQEWRKTEVKTRLWESIETLPPNDRTLLMLRLHQQMRWTEIARVLNSDEDPDPALLKRSAAAARKRFERLKGGLRERMNADS